MKKVFLFGGIFIVVLAIFFLASWFVRQKFVSAQSSFIPPVFTEPSPIPIYPDITLEAVFDGKLNQPPGSTTIIATGDVIPSRAVNYNTLQRNNFMWPYEKIASFVSNADITVIDLETPIFDQCPVTQEGFKFCGEDGHIEGIKAMGVDVASLGNNHAGNYGVDGVSKTIDLLRSNNIAVMGMANQSPVIKEVNGTRFAFLGYDDIASESGIAHAEEEQIKKDIALARTLADVVIVEYHWGIEYRDLPDNRQIELGHFTIDSGADIVIGNHPHWIQPPEIYKGKYIMYAHGNTIFDQMWSEETKKGVVGKYVFVGPKLIDVKYYPTYIRDYGQPSFMEEPQKQKVLDDLWKASQTLKLSY